jgi:hypothetical protein
MKVLKPGRNQDGPSRKRKCTGRGNGGGGCGALLLVADKDVFQTHHCDFGGGHDIYNTFKCPSCGTLKEVE